jgi:putative ABC transport system ATP-binding protein
MTVSLVTLHNVKKAFTIRKGVERVVLNELNLTINSGDWISIGGSSGSGKTTILRVINGGLQVDEGKVEITTDLPLLDQKIVYVTQHPILRPYLTVLENLLEVNNDYKRAIELLQATKLENVKDSYYDELSGGEFNRASLCRSVMSDPLIILIDEPTANLDLKSSELVISFLEKLWNNGVTLVVASHSKKVLNVAKRRFDLISGQLIENEG